MTILGEIAKEMEHRVGPYYENSDLHNTQFAGRIPEERESFSEILDDRGFEKVETRLDTTEYSWRRVNDDEQLHVILYDGNEIKHGDRDCTYVYAHYEPLWEDAPVATARRNVQDPGRGIREMKKLFDELGIIYDPIRP